MADAEMESSPLAARSQLKPPSEQEEGGETKQGGWITLPFIAGSMVGLGLAISGTSSNLQIYLIKEYNVESIDAAQIANIVRGSLNLVPVAGAILSDSYFGCFPVILAGAAINVLMKAVKKAAKKAKAGKAEKAEKALWDAYHTRIFCELCARECEAGNRPGPFLSNRGYNNLGESWFEITKKSYVRMQFKNRWDALKTMYCQWKQLQIDASGLGWNDKLGTIDASNEWWNIHLVKHPEHAKYRNGGPPNLAEMDLMFDDRHVTGAESAIPGEIPLDKEVTNIQDDTDSEEDDDEVIKEIPKKKRKTRSTKDDFSSHDEKNPFVRMYKKASDAICVTAESIKEASSSNKAPPPPPIGPSMNDAMEMVRECGVEEGTPLFFSSSMLFMKAEYREMFASVQTKEGRFDWLERAHDFVM